MKPGHLLKVKLLAAILAGAALIGGGTAVLAATPAGQQTLHALTGSASDSVTPDATKQGHDAHNNSCPGLLDAQRLATQFSLSPASESGALQAICALHAGTFKGTTPGGSAVSSSRIFGYGEIKLLLT